MGPDRPLPATFVADFSASGHRLGVRRSKEACEDQVGKAERREQSSAVLWQAAVACLAMLEQALYDTKTMPDFRAHAGLGWLHSA